MIQVEELFQPRPSILESCRPGSRQSFMPAADMQGGLLCALPEPKLLDVSKAESLASFTVRTGMLEITPLFRQTATHAGIAFLFQLLEQPFLKVFLF